MAYIPAVYDRTQTDIDNKTSKAYFNISDWNRIANNIIVTRHLVDVIRDISVGFTLQYHTMAVFGPTSTASIDTFTPIATLTNSITNLRAAVLDEIPSLPSITSFPTPGTNQPAPNYTHVNQWESVVNTVWDFYGGPALLVCPSLGSNITRAAGTTTIFVDCLDMEDFNVDLQDTARLAII